MKITLAIISLALCMCSCRMYERDYLEEIPIPEITIDTIDTGKWEDPVIQR